MTDVYWYHPDYLGNTEFVTDIGGYPYQHLFYSPFGEAIVSQQYTSGRYDNPHRFNAKELDPETGLYYYGARFYNPKTSIWLSVDPLYHLSPTQTPYHYCSNNPVMRIDLDGRNDDDITVNNEGIITDIVINDEPNRFFDEQGNELFLNDADNADEHLLEGKFQIGDQLFFNVSNQEYAEAIINAGIVFNSNGILTLLEVALKSYGEADFAHYYLAAKYPIHLGGTDGDGVIRSGYPDQAGYFRFENTNVIYNLYDAGNHMWGSWMRINNFSERVALKAANLNDLGRDTPADQRAISRGYNYVK